MYYIWHIENIEASSGIFSNNSYENINIFFQFNLAYFSRKFEKTYFLTTMTSISTLDWVYLRIRWRLIIIRPPAVAGGVLWIRVSPSIRFSVQRFSWDWLISFFWNSARCQGPMWCCAWQNRIFEKKNKKLLPPKWGKLAKNGPRIAFF